MPLIHWKRSTQAFDYVRNEKEKKNVTRGTRFKIYGTSGYSSYQNVVAVCEEQKLECLTSF